MITVSHDVGEYEGGPADQILMPRAWHNGGMETSRCCGYSCSLVTVFTGSLQMDTYVVPKQFLDYSCKAHPRCFVKRCVFRLFRCGTVDQELVFNIFLVTFV